MQAAAFTHNFTVQSNLWITTTEGTGNRWSYFSGGLINFVRFGSKIFNTEFYTCPCQRHQRSVVPTCTRGRNWQRPCQTELVNMMIARLECLRRKSWTIEKYFSLNLTYVVAFHRLNRHFGPTSGVRNSHFSGGRNFKNALRTFESANWRDWNCVSSIFRWSLLSGGCKDRFDCTNISVAPIFFGQGSGKDVAVF